MRSVIRFSLLCSLASLLVLAGAAQASAQARPGAQRPQAQGPQGDGLTPADIQRMFDAVSLLEAQKALDLSDEQYGGFARRMKSLHDVRRRHQNQRNRLLRELAQLTNAGADEATISAKVQAYDAHEVEAATAMRAAYASVDESLTPRQRARFRLFEEQMERKKLDLLMRARQANRRQ